MKENRNRGRKMKKKNREIAIRLPAVVDQIILMETPTPRIHSVLGHHLCLVAAGNFLLCRQAQQNF